MVEVSVIIVTWNSESVIDDCVKSVINNWGESKTELIIIDNDSKDSTNEKLMKIGYSNLHVYRNQSNLGFTKAVNQGIRMSTGKNILLLNPDTELKPHCIDLMKNFLGKNPDYGASCPLLLSKDGSVQQSIRNFPSYWNMFCEFSLLAYIFPKTKVFGKWKMKYFTYEKDEDVNQPMAAALMIKKETLEEIGFMDERFEMFFNDVDMCKRIIDSGLKIRFLTSAQIVHQKGESIYKDRKRMINIWNKDCIKYFEKYHRNSLLLLWLKINLKISGKIRVLLSKN